MLRLIAFLAFAIFAASPASATLQIGDVAVLRLPDTHQIRFTLRTAGGYAGFDVGEDWGVKVMQSRPPITISIFQIPDAAAEGTPESTNLRIDMIPRDSDEGGRLLAHIADVDRDAAVIHYKNWTLDPREIQGATQYTPGHYTSIDAFTPVADVICNVRLAWPRLAGHGADYDSKMDALLKVFLDSVAGGTGDYTGHPGEVVRSPTQ